MSLRAKLTWAFLAVVLVALVPAALILNAGFNMDAMGPGMGRGMMMGRSAMMEAHQYVIMARRWTIVGSVAAFFVAGALGVWAAGRITRSHLEAAERLRRQLLADVAHELRHPLAVMKGRLELMQEDRAPIDQESLLPLQDEVIRLTRLVGDLRDLSLADAGGLSLHKTRLEPGELLGRLYTDMEPVAAAKSIDLALELEGSLPALHADPDRLRQVFVNLLANALQYTPEGGKVTIRAARAGQELRVTIGDTGPGIAQEDLAHIFDRFYRADRSRSRATGGSGLGLAIVRSLVELHRGRVEAQSRPGHGTAMTVSLPLA